MYFSVFTYTKFDFIWLQVYLIKYLVTILNEWRETNSIKHVRDFEWLLTFFFFLIRDFGFEHSVELNSIQVKLLFVEWILSNGIIHVISQISTRYKQLHQQQIKTFEVCLTCKLQQLVTCEIKISSYSVSMVQV